MNKHSSQERTTTSGSPRLRKAKTWGKNEWWLKFFDDNWKRLGFGSIEPEQTGQETDFLTKALDLKQDERILDQACGIGRHSLELARRGFRRVTGLDFTQGYIKEAILKAEHEDLKVEFVHGDMKDLPFADSSFDAVYNFFTSFGYFADELDNERVLKEVSRVLKPGGRFLLDVVHRDYVVRNFQARGWSEYDGEFVLEERRFDLTTSRNECTWVYIGKRGKTEKPVSLRMYSLHELRAMFERSGLTFTEAWGTWDFELLTWDHFRQKLLAVKPR
ncbi:methyltransferase domain-containing protein [candidate division WOR-3 bacterium]|nr:methyltransferase domain-containing protein [candidate division WOR-3 bacterium]